MQNFEKLNEKEIVIITNILVNAFFDDPFYNYIFPDKTIRQKQLFWLMTKLVLYGQIYGRIETTNTPINGVVIWLKPSSPMIKMVGLIRLGILKAPFIFGLNGTRKIIRISNEWEKLQKKESKRHWYLLAIGVDPKSQGKGVGSSLIKPVLNEADKSKLPCYLETMTMKDVNFYKKHGFEIITERMINEQIPYWTMRRDPRKSY